MWIPIISITERRGILEKEILNSTGFSFGNVDIEFRHELEDVTFLGQNDNFIFLQISSQDKIEIVGLEKIRQVGDP